MWGLFFGGLFLTIPLIGHVVVLGYLAATAISAVEGAVVVGGMSAVGASLAGIGIPKNSILRYETAIKADDFLVMAHGQLSEMTRARSVLATMHPKHLDMHSGPQAVQPAYSPIHAGA